MLLLHCQFYVYIVYNGRTLCPLALDPPPLAWGTAASTSLLCRNRYWNTVIGILSCRNVGTGFGFRDPCERDPASLLVGGVGQPQSQFYVRAKKQEVGESIWVKAKKSK